MPTRRRDPRPTREPVPGAGGASALASARLAELVATGRVADPEALAELSDRLAAAGTPRLEESLADHLRSLSGPRSCPDRLVVLGARLGLAGTSPLSLADAGRAIGVSGERVRQMEVRVRARQAEAGACAQLPQLDLALATVAAALPIPAHAVGPLLAESGVSSREFALDSLVAAARFLGRVPPFVVKGRGPDAVVVPRTGTRAAEIYDALAVARRLARRSGATTMGAWPAELSATGNHLPVRRLGQVLSLATDVAVHRPHWLWFSDDAAKGPFVAASLRMLAVHSPLAVASLRDGLARRSGRDGVTTRVPEEVLLRVYEDSPAFVVGDDGRVRPAVPVDRSLLGPVQLRLVELIENIPRQPVERAVLLQEAYDAGLNLSSVTLYLTYSECLERVAPGRFVVRGTQVSTSGSRRSLAPALRRSGRLPDGRGWLAAELTAGTCANGVVRLPGGIRTGLAEQTFLAHGPAGEPSTVRVDRHGNSWSWLALLRAAQARPGHTVRLVFDPANGRVDLELGGAELLAPPATPTGPPCESRILP